MTETKGICKWCFSPIWNSDNSQYNSGHEYHSRCLIEMEAWEKQNNSRTNGYDWIKYRGTIFKNNSRMLTTEIDDFEWSKWIRLDYWKANEDGIGYTLKTHIKIPLNLKTWLFFIKYKTKFIVTWKDV